MHAIDIHAQHKPYRRRLPTDRTARTVTFVISGHEVTMTAGEYEDGSLGEIFFEVSKSGSTLSGVLDAMATTVSLALQYNVPLSVLADKFIGMSFEPSGYVGGEYARSIFDYAFRWLMERYG